MGTLSHQKLFDSKRPEYQLKKYFLKIATLDFLYSVQNRNAPHRNYRRKTLPRTPQTQASFLPIKPV
jgi:hypothetical protein